VFGISKKPGSVRCRASYAGHSYPSRNTLENHDFATLPHGIRSGIATPLAMAYIFQSFSKKALKSCHFHNQA
jgi:hypothetical protein